MSSDKATAFILNTIHSDSPVVGDYWVTKDSIKHIVVKVLGNSNIVITGSNPNYKDVTVFNSNTAREVTLEEHLSMVTLSSNGDFSFNVRIGDPDALQWVAHWERVYDGKYIEIPSVE